MKYEVLTQVYITEDLDEFKLNNNNRKVNDKNVQSIKDTFKDKNGIVTPVIVDQDYYIIDGQHRYQAVKEWNKENPNNRISLPFIIKNTKGKKQFVSTLITVNTTGKQYDNDEIITLHAENNPNGASALLIRASNKTNGVLSPIQLFRIITNGADMSRMKRIYLNPDNFVKGYEDENNENWQKIYNFCILLEELKEYANFKGVNPLVCLFNIFNHKNFNKDNFKNHIIKEYKKCYEKIDFTKSGEDSILSGRSLCYSKLLRIHNSGISPNSKSYINSSIINGHVELL